MLEGMYRDIATIVAEKCVNPETKRPYTVTMIEKAMADLHLSVNPSRSAKSQALDVIKQLLEKGTIPIARAQMRIRIVVSSKDGKKIKDKLMSMIASKEDEDFDENYEWVRYRSNDMIGMGRVFSPQSLSNHSLPFFFRTVDMPD